MNNMRPENSFPQICVVSAHQFVGIASLRQEYGGIVSRSNQVLITQESTPLRGLSFPGSLVPFSDPSERLIARIVSSIRLSTPVFRINRPT